MHGVLPVEDVPEALPAHVDPAGELGHADAAVLSGALDAVIASLQEADEAERLAAAAQS